MSNSSHIHVSDTGELRRIVIDRPDKANALSTDMVRALEAAFVTAAASHVRAIVVSSEGKNFCAGGDLAELRSGQRSEQYGALCTMIRAVAERTVPLITVTHGKILGAGCVFLALGDIVLAAEDSVIGIPEIHFGMYPVLVHHLLLERLPYSLVFQLCIGARTLTARDALELGLATETLPSADFVRRTAERIDYYTQRIDALEVGRKLQLPKFGGNLYQRTREAEALFDRNLAVPAVQALLQEWQQ